MTTPHFVYITAKDREQALKIGEALVQERLVACVNILENMTSLYWWNQAVQRDNEVVLIAKTKEDLLDQLISRVKDLHSYECPCVVSWPIPVGNEEYLHWIVNETR